MSNQIKAIELEQKALDLVLSCPNGSEAGKLRLGIYTGGLAQEDRATYLRLKESKDAVRWLEANGVDGWQEVLANEWTQQERLAWNAVQRWTAIVARMVAIPNHSGDGKVNFDRKERSWRRLRDENGDAIGWEVVREPRHENDTWDIHQYYDNPVDT